jgi:hypothetical protein
VVAEGHPTTWGAGTSAEYNGSEFIAKIVQRWLKDNRIKTLYIEPESP